MSFTHDTEIALTEAAALVNTDVVEPDDLRDQDTFVAFLAAHPFSGTHLGTDAELRSVRRLRERLRAFWDLGDRDDVAEQVNDLLHDAGARPYLARHDQWDWHLHVTTPDAPIAHRIGAEAAMGLLDLVRADELDRLKRCVADDCDAVLVDLSRNRSKRYCDTGNCANRAHVQAYRARRAQE